MTIAFPDISNFQKGLRIQPGTVAVCAKSTEGTYFTDPSYSDFKTQAAAVGALFWAYHFLVEGNGAAQADYCFRFAGASVPVMLDVEPIPAQNSTPGIAEILAFTARYRQLGGRVCVAYLPRWYWEHLGRPDLTVLGLPIVASGYPGGYSDTDANWSPYGGVTPSIWQYTDSQPYGGMSVDFNAFRGTVQELAALINGTSTGTSTGTTPMPNIPASIAAAIPDVAADFPPGAPYSDDNAIIWADARAAAAMLYARQARDTVNALAAHFTPVDETALAKALAPLLNAGASADQIASAVVSHLASALTKS
jgi:GH25 family lysozyme M1 (1,4-beta-N-acetylmuramidase)